MAQKKKSGTTKSTGNSTVTRIKASDTKKTAAIHQEPKERIADAPEPVAEKRKKARRKPTRGGVLRPFVAIKDYFVGAWVELKQVRWPTRRATWSLTFAVLVYTAFFVLLVILLDVAFKYLFDVILGK